MPKIPDGISGEKLFELWVETLSGLTSEQKQLVKQALIMLNSPENAAF